MVTTNGINIVDAYTNGVQVKEIYSNGVLVWPTEPPLPPEFQRVKAIYNNGNNGEGVGIYQPYIEIPFPDGMSNFKVEINFIKNRSSRSSIATSRDFSIRGNDDWFATFGYSFNNFSWGQYTDNVFCCYYNDELGVPYYEGIGRVIEGDEHKVWFSSTEIGYDGEVIDTFEYEHIYSGQFVMNSLRLWQQHNIKNYPGEGFSKITGIKIFQNNFLKMNLIPALNTTNSKPCFYDTINDVVYYNQANAKAELHYVL